MGAAESRSSFEEREELKDQFVLIMTAPPGTGKEQLMSSFIEENLRKVAYVAKIGAVRASEPGLIYFYESIADAKAEPSQQDSYPTILQAVQAALQDGKSVVADVDVSAVRALRASNVPGCYVFVLPASMQALRESITANLPNPTEDEIERTVMASEKEILAVDEPHLYDYSIQNEDQTSALESFSKLAQQSGLVASDVLTIPTATTVRSGSLNNSTAGTPKTGNTSVAANPTGTLPASQPKGTTAAAGPQWATTDANSAVSEGPNSSGTPGDLVVPPGLGRWQGSIAVVTGASNGPGALLCEALAATGVHVVGAASSKDHLQALQARILASGVGSRMFLPVMCDVSREDEVKTLMSIAVKTFDGKPVGLLINAAGTHAPQATIMDGVSRVWVDVLSSNVLSVALCCREACTSMRRSDAWGHIVNLATLPDRDDASCSFSRASVAAVRHISQGLQQEAAASGCPLRVSTVLTSPISLPPRTDKPVGRQSGNLEEGLSAADVANSVLHVISQPSHVDVGEVLLNTSGHGIHAHL